MKGGVNQQLTFENKNRERDALTRTPAAKAANTLLNTFLIGVLRWSRRFNIFVIR